MRANGLSKFCFRMIFILCLLSVANGLGFRRKIDWIFQGDLSRLINIGDLLIEFQNRTFLFYLETLHYFYFAYKCNFPPFQPSWSDGILIYCKACSENITTSDHLINIRSEQSIGMERNKIETYYKNRTSSQYSYEKWIVCFWAWNYCTRNLIIFSIRSFVDIYFQIWET